MYLGFGGGGGSLLEAGAVVLFAAIANVSRSSCVVDFYAVSTLDDGSIPLAPRSNSFPTGMLMFNDDRNALGCKCKRGVLASVT